MARTGRPLIDLTGRPFGHWRVLRRADVNDPSGGPLWLCRCGLCGRRKLIRGWRLRKPDGTRKCDACNRRLRREGGLLEGL